MADHQLLSLHAYSDSDDDADLFSESEDEELEANETVLEDCYLVLMSLDLSI